MNTTEDKVYYGKVVWFCNKKGYGFISWEKDGVVQRELFLHFSDIDVVGFKTLSKDQCVSFRMGENRHGAPKAINVTPI